MCMSSGRLVSCGKVSPQASKQAQTSMQRRVSGLLINAHGQEMLTPEQAISIVFSSYWTYTLLQECWLCPARITTPCGMLRQKMQHSEAYRAANNLLKFAKPLLSVKNTPRKPRISLLFLLLPTITTPRKPPLDAPSPLIFSFRLSRFIVDMDDSGFHRLHK